MVTFPFQFDQRYQPGQIPQFGSFGPANISNMLQSSVSKLADPMIARLRELEVVNKAAALNRETSDIFKQPAAPSPPGASAPAAGVLGTPSAPFVNPAASKGNAGGSFALGQGMDPGTAEPTLGGTGTVRPSSMLEAGKIGIAGVESGGRADPYSAKGPDVPRRDGTVDNAWGKYQVMGSNVGPWTEKYLGQRMTPQEFAANPAAQERVFEGEFGSYLDQYGNLRDAASKWFSGRPMKEAVASGANDRYTSVPSYISQMEQHIKRAYAGGGPPAPQQAPTASFAPTVAPAPTPAAAAAVASPAAAQVHTDAATGRPIAADDPRINPDIQGRPIMPGGQRQVASLDPSVGTGSIRPPAPEVPVRRMPPQALGPDGQPLPPGQQPAAPLPSGPPPNEQPDPPPPPPVQPPPPPVPPVQPPPPVQQAALPTPPVPASQQVAPPSVAPAVAAPPPGASAAGVPLPQAPTRMTQAAPQQAAPQQRAAPFDQTADRFWEAVGRNAQTPEQALVANTKRLELRQPKNTFTVVDGVLVRHNERGEAEPVYGHQLKGPPTIKIKEGDNERALQYDHKTDRWIPIGPEPSGAGDMFKGNSVEGQSLNHLVRQNILTRDQAATVGAGKTVTQPNGEQYFIPPQDLAGVSVGVVRRSPDGTITPVLPQAAPAAPATPGATQAPAGPPPTPGAVRLTPAKDPDKVAPEPSARIGMGNEFLADVPGIRKQIIDGALDSPKARMQLRYGYGEPGQMARRNSSGREALVRGLTGMGMPQSEAEDYAERYKFTYKDTKENFLWKLENLERELRATREAVLSGHRITDPALRGRDTPDPNRKGFKTPSGTDFYEVR